MSKAQEYEEFVEKFKLKKTTDDCYTFDNIYDVVAEWVVEKYGFNRADFVRPFYPGGDYEHYEYQDGCAVVDNPPFSIGTKIVKFYQQRKIPFFLFAISNKAEISAYCTVICVNSRILFTNGASIGINFTTNMEPPEIALKSEPELYRRLKAANQVNEKANKKELRKLKYPDNVVTAAAVGYFSVHDTKYELSRNRGVFIRALDVDRPRNIFGGGWLCSSGAATERAAAERAAAERAAAERAAAERLTLSPREVEIIRGLDANERQLGR